MTENATETPSGAQGKAITNPTRWIVNGFTDLCALDGLIVGPSDASWQDVAGTAAVNLRALANHLDRVRDGRETSWARPDMTKAIEMIGDEVDLS